jgi:hypothetical protein
MAHVITSKRLGLLIGFLAGGSAILGGCGGEIRAERQGRQFGEAICDVTEADDALVEQDIAVIQRNLAAVGGTLTGKGRAAYDGIQEGLGDCDY